MGEPSVDPRVESDGVDDLSDQIVLEDSEFASTPDDETLYRFELLRSDKDAVAAENEKLRQEARREAAKTETLELQNESLKKDQTARKHFSIFAACLVSVWVVATLVVLALCGSEDCPWRLQLSDAVLVAFISGVSVQVIGLLLAVIQYLFWRPRQ